MLMKTISVVVFLSCCSLIAMAQQDKTDNSFVFSGEMQYLIIPTECYDIFTKDFNLTHMPCVKMTFSKLLGYAIIVGAGILKVPQIAIILQARDVTGITFDSQYFELIGFTSGAVYNYLIGSPISTYGENLLIMVQMVVIILLMWKFAKGDHTKSVSHCFIVSTLYVALIAGMVHSPSEYRPYFFWIGLFSGIISRLPQIVINLVNRHTGRISFISTLLSTAGSLARIFTTLQEVEDSSILLGFLVSGSLNVIMLLEIVVFWKNTVRVLSKDDQKKKD